MTAPVLSLPVRVLRSATAGRRPGDGTYRALTDGEVFINTQDRVLCFLDASGTLVAFPIDPAVLALLAPLASPVLTGSPKAPTAAAGDSSTLIATTAFVAAAVAAILAQIEGGAPGALDTLKELADALGDDPNYAATTAAALALRLRVDVAQGLTGAQQIQGRSNLGLDARHSVADAAYAIAATDRLVAVTSLTAARILTLPAATAFPVGPRLRIIDEAGKAGTYAVSIAPNGTDKINGVNAAVLLGVNFGSVELESNGTAWTVVDAAVPTAAEIAAGLGYAPARPVTAFGVTNTGVGIAANSASNNIGAIGFTATAGIVHIDAFADVKSQGGATEFSMYIQLYDNTSGGVAVNGPSSGCYITTAATNGGNVAISLSANGLNIGHSYTAVIYAAATSVAVTCNSTYIGGVNL